MTGMCPGIALSWCAPRRLTAASQHSNLQLRTMPGQREHPASGRCGTQQAGPTAAHQRTGGRAPLRIRPVTPTLVKMGGRRRRRSSCKWTGNFAWCVWSAGGQATHPQCSRWTRRPLARGRLADPVADDVYAGVYAGGTDVAACVRWPPAACSGWSAALCDNF